MYILFTVIFIALGKPNPLFDECNIDWAPSVNFGHESTPRTSSDRYIRAMERQKNKRRQTECDEMNETTPTTGNTTQALATASGTQTVLTTKDLENLENSEAQHVKE